MGWKTGKGEEVAGRHTNMMAENSFLTGPVIPAVILNPERSSVWKRLTVTLHDETAPTLTVRTHRFAFAAHTATALRNGLLLNAAWCSGTPELPFSKSAA